MPRSRPAPRRPGAAWVLSNHDFGRLVTRFGPENARAAALMLLTLPGPAFLYQGDEIGLGDGPGGERAYDRAGRDRYRHPMQWDASPSGGFTTGDAWLPPVDPGARPTSRPSARTLARRSRSCATCWRCGGVLGEGLELVEAPPGVLAYRRGDHLIAINTSGEEQPDSRARRSGARDHTGRFPRPHPRGALRCDYAV